jgi:UDPglucose 6-dehydrogenase
MKITMIGTGYVGLVSGVCFSDFGHDVVCVDKDPRKIDMLNAGEVPIYEPGLDLLMAKNVEAGRLSFTTDLASAVADADAIFIAVGTPTRRGDGHADLTYVMAAAEEVASALTGYAVIVTKSTVPVGTNRKVKQVVAKANPEAEFDVASNPEFLREGAAIDDFMRPDRVVVGVQTERAAEVMADVYRPLFLRDFPIITTDLESAEMIKYAANAFLATKITFINEIAALCERVGADVKEVSKGMGLDGRIGNKFLHAGPGYGGSCFPEGHQRAGTHRAGTRRAAKYRGDGDPRERWREDAHDREAERPVRRILQRQDDRGSWRDLQTQHRRHARCAVTDHRPALVGGGAKVRVVDPQGARGREASARRALARRSLQGGAERRPGRDPDGMERVPRTRPEAAGQEDGEPRMADLRNIYSARDARRAGFEAYDAVGRGGLEPDQSKLAAE